MTATGAAEPLAVVRRVLDSVRSSQGTPSGGRGRAKDVMSEEDLEGFLRAVSGRGATPTRADVRSLRTLVGEHAGTISFLSGKFGLPPKELLVQVAIGAIPGDRGYVDPVASAAEDWTAGWEERWAADQGADLVGVGTMEFGEEKVVCVAATGMMAADTGGGRMGARGPDGVEVMRCVVGDDPDAFVVATRLLEQVMPASGVREATIEVRPDRDGPYLQVRLRGVRPGGTDRVLARLEAWRQAIEQLCEHRGQPVRVRWVA